MTISLSRSIFSTLSYHSRFSYPLTLFELHRFLLINRPLSSNEVKREVIKLLRHRELCHRQSVAISSGLPRRPDPRSGLLAMTGNEKFFDLRLKRHQVSVPKLTLARRAARLIGFIPSVKLVCLTGSLAMENSDPDDDIDLMIVTSQNRLWLTRPLVILLVSLFFKRRKPINNQQFPPKAGPPLAETINNHSNEICLNLWLDENALEMTKPRQTSATAHELAQMKPLVNKNQTYEKMLSVNSFWAKNFLANFWRLVYRHSERSEESRRDPSFARGELRMTVGNLLNSLLFRFQYLYMKSKRTTEEVTLHSAFFHPIQKSQLKSASIG